MVNKATNPKLKNYYKEIVNYYDSSQLLYRLFCYDQNSLGMHFGFWDKDIKNRQEAIENENQEIIDMGKIIKDQKVLDAGCGVGGTAIYIAKHTEAKVWGITLSENQVMLAKNYAKKNCVSDLVIFSKQNYHKTNFPNNFFDVIYGIESVCHSFPKKDFLKEAFRILKPKGRLVIADGYCSREPSNKGEKTIVDNFTKSFALKEMIIDKKMTDQIVSSGFIRVREINKTECIWESVLNFYKFFLIIDPIIKLFSFISFSILKSIRRNIIAMFSWKKGLESGLFSYYIHYAEKP